MEVRLDRRNSEDEEDGEGRPRAHSRSLGEEEKSPKTRKNEE
jgi:hypothetical protein